MKQRLELTRHHHVDEQNAEENHELHVAFAFGLVFDDAAELDADALGREHLGHDLAHVVHHLALRAVERIKFDVDDALLVLAPDFDGAGDLGDLGDGIETHAAATGRDKLGAADILDGAAAGLVKAHENRVEVLLVAELRGLVALEERVHGLGDVVHRKPERGCAEAVDANLDLRLVVVL